MWFRLLLLRLVESKGFFGGRLITKAIRPAIFYSKEKQPQGWFSAALSQRFAIYNQENEQARSILIFIFVFFIFACCAVVIISGFKYMLRLFFFRSRNSFVHHLLVSSELLVIPGW